MHTHVTDSAHPSVAARHLHNERYLPLAISVRHWQLIFGTLLILSPGLGAVIVSIS